MGFRHFGYRSFGKDGGGNQVYFSGNVGIRDDESRNKLDVWNGYFGLSNTNVDHGMTSLTTTNLYGYFWPIGNLTNGGLEIGALSDTDATAFKLLGVIGSTDLTDTTPAIVLQGAKKSGTGQGALSAAERYLKFKTTLRT